MKHIFALVVGALLSWPILVQAQLYDKAHQIKASEVQDFTFPTFRKSEARGSTATQIMALQYLLRNRGFYKAKVDGKFGELTERAVRDFQRAKGLKVDGIVGPQTWTPLLLRLKKGDRGDAVRALQILLRGVPGQGNPDPFRDQEVDGDFGSETLLSVLQYQKYWNDDYLRTIDGIVGPRTWGALLGADFGDQH